MLSCDLTYECAYVWEDAHVCVCDLIIKAAIIIKRWVCVVGQARLPWADGLEPGQRIKRYQMAPVPCCQREYTHTHTHTHTHTSISFCVSEFVNSDLISVYKWLIQSATETRGAQWFYDSLRWVQAGQRFWSVSWRHQRSNRWLRFGQRGGGHGPLQITYEQHRDNSSRQTQRASTAQSNERAAVNQQHDTPTGHTHTRHK